MLGNGQPPNPFHSQSFRQIRDYERQFVATLEGFVAAVPAERRAHVERVCRSYAAAWGQALDGTRIVAGLGYDALLAEATRSFWRQYYRRNRERELLRKKELYVPRPLVTALCQTCGKQFSNRLGTKFCSKSCRRKAGYKPKLGFGETGL